MTIMTNKQADEHARLIERVKIAEELARRSKTNRRALYVPNDVQWEYLSCKAKEVLLSGVNQHGGKTYTQRYEISVHATGDYPPEWKGIRFDRPPTLIVMSQNHEKNRDEIIHHLFAEHFDMQDIDLIGPGWIRPEEYNPEDLIPSNRARGSLSTAKVFHRGPDGEINGKTMIYFLSYEGGQKQLKGKTANMVLGNENPDMKSYSEMKARINATDGYLRIVGCPLEEEPDVYYQFKECTDQGVMRLIEYSIHQCSHMDPDLYQSELRRWEHHPEAEARLYGRPCRGSGLVFPYQRFTYTMPAAKPLATDHCIIGLDFPHGVGVFAAVLLAIDRTNDVYKVLAEYKMSSQEAPIHAQRVKLMGGDKIPCAWPKDGHVRTGSLTDSQAIAEKYRDLGLNLTYDNAFYWSEGNKSHAVMPIVEEIQERIVSGRFKVSEACPELLAELRGLRHKDGKLKRVQNDDLFDALVKAVMMAREAVAFGPGGPQDRRTWTPPPPRGEVNFYD